jgi:multidrug efflux system membrane fusion protein
MPKQNPFKRLKAKTEDFGLNIRLAALFIALIVLWMLSGLFGATDTTQKEAVKASLKTVEVLEVSPEQYTRFIEITGTSEPYQLVNLAARIETQVQKILKDRGARIEKGTVLLKLDEEQRQESLTAAKLDLKRAEALYNAASKLNQQGYRADTSLDTRRAELAMAKEVLKRAENDLSYTNIKSPIDGLVEDRMVEVGDYVKKGDIVYQLVSKGIYKIITHISQKDHDLVSLNETAFATLSNGLEVSGTITFVSTNAHPTTRTYKVEIEIQSEKPIPTGMSAKVRIPTATTTAYLLPYASMVLNDEGLLGAMILKEGNVTQFNAINPLDDNGGGVYITGFNKDKIEVVVKGQNSLVDGEQVEKTLVAEPPQVSEMF